MKNLFVLLIMILICGCDKSSKMQDDVQVISLIDLSENALNMSEFIDSTKYIRLETTPDNLIGEVSQLIPLKDKLMVVDKTFTQSIYFFTNTGKYLYSINHRGVAPDEYIKIASVAVDPQNDRLFIYDAKQGKVLLYTMEGTYLDSFQPSFFFTDIAYVGDQKLVCFCDYYAKDDRLRVKDQVPMLVLYDLKTKEKEPYCYEDISIEMTEVTDGHMLFQDNSSSTAFCSYPLNNNVYQITPQGVSKGYYLDFGTKDQARKDAYMLRLRTEDIKPEQIYSGMVSSDFFQLTGCMDSDKLTFVGYKNDQTNLLGVTICDKESKKQVNGLTKEGWPIENNVNGGYPLMPYALQGRQMYTVIPPEYFESKEVTDPVLSALVANITSDDNPVIMINTVNLK